VQSTGPSSWRLGMVLETLTRKKNCYKTSYKDEVTKFLRELYSRGGGGGGKVKLSLFLTKHRCMKAYWGMEIQNHAFLTSALDGGEW